MRGGRARLPAGDCERQAARRKIAPRRAFAPVPTFGGETMHRSMTAFLLAGVVCAAVPLDARAQGSGLPQAAGKEMVEGVCTACHQTDMITRSSGYTRDGWKELIGTMIDLSASPVEHAAITE